MDIVVFAGFCLVNLSRCRAGAPGFLGASMAKSKTVIIGVGELYVSNNPDEIIRTLALGSCVAFLVYEPKSRIAGMAHIALSDSAVNPESARTQPGRFADTGIPALMNKVCLLSKTDKGFIIKLAGGANIARMTDHFNIGKRNILAIKKILWRHRLASVAEDLGGKISRTVSIEVNTGAVTVQSPGLHDWLL